MEHHVDALGREVVVEDARVVEFDRVVEVVGRPEVEVVDRDDLVVVGEVVREIRADESGTASNEDSFAIHTSKLSPSDKNLSSTWSEVGAGSLVLFRKELGWLPTSQTE